MSAYIFASVEITDPAAYEEYRRRVPAIIAAYGGRYLARGGAVESRSLFSLAQVSRAGSSAPLEALSTPLRRRRSTPSSMLGRFECVTDPIAVRDPLS